MCLFLQVEWSNTLAFCKIPWGLRSALEGFPSIFLCPEFLEYAPKLLANLMTIPVQNVLNFPYYIIGGILYCFRVAISVWTLLSGRRSCGIIISLGFLSKRVSGIIGGIDSPLRSNVPGSLIPALFYCHPLVNKVSRIFPPFALTVFLYVALFPLVLSY